MKSPVNRQPGIRMFEYKVVPAPARTVKVKGLKTTADRFAHLLAESLNAEAGEGWEYLRAETLPFEERKGFTGTSRGFQTVLIFRRALAPEPSAADQDFVPEAPAVYAPAVVPPPPLAAEPEAETGRVARFPAFGRAEPLFRPEAVRQPEAAPRAEPSLRATMAERPDTAPQHPAPEGDDTPREPR